LPRRKRITTINIVRRPEQVQSLQALGANFVLGSSQPDFDLRLRDLCHQLRATLVFDMVAGDLTCRLLAALPSGGHVLLVGLVARQASRVDARHFVFEGKRVDGFWLAEWFPKQSMAYQLLARLRVQMLASHELKSDVRERVSLEATAKALNRYADLTTGGKMLITQG
jgi:NADPH:quinone reductase